jgi:hypothetical protein
MAKRLWLVMAMVLMGASTLFLGRSGAQDSTTQSGGWNAEQLKKAIEDIGYETKALNATAGEEKYEFKVERGGLTIPIGAELSKSKNYLWLTVNLTSAPKDFADSGTKLGNLLKANSVVQPCQFYITEKGALMIAVPVENRAMSNAILRRNVEKLANDVVSQKSVWQ